MNVLKRLFARRDTTDRADHKNDWPSVVLLLREPLFPSPEEAVKTGQAAWGAAGPVELISVTNDGKSYILKQPKLVYAVHLSRERYGVQGQETSEAQQLPWDEHHAWMSIDLPTARLGKLREDKALGSVYKLLLVYAFISWSPNCLGVYFSAESVTVPNLGDLGESIKWGRKNGIDLSFLD